MVGAYFSDEKVWNWILNSCVSCGLIFYLYRKLQDYFTCEICSETVSGSNKFKNNTMCNHSFCSDCIAKYVEAKVVEFNIANIACPALDCKFSLDPLSCRPILSTSLFDQWCELLCHDTLTCDFDDSARCYCPYPDCSSLVVNECVDGGVTKCMCPNCKNKFCFKCKSEWHAGYECSEVPKYRDRNDVLFGELIERKKWTRCPKCGHSVERNGGCPHMRCRCGHNFCHECGRNVHHGSCFV